MWFISQRCKYITCEKILKMLQLKSEFIMVCIVHSPSPFGFSGAHSNFSFATLLTAICQTAMLTIGLAGRGAFVVSVWAGASSVVRAAKGGRIVCIGSGVISLLVITIWDALLLLHDFASLPSSKGRAAIGEPRERWWWDMIREAHASEAIIK